MPHNTPEKRRAYRRKYMGGKHGYYMANKAKWDGYVRSVNGRFHRFKATAKKKGREWGLTYEEYAAFVSLPCSYCGGDLPETGGGLDRQNHHAGYVIGNVVPCCSRCNTNKGALEMAGFTYPRTVELLRELVRNRT